MTHVPIPMKTLPTAPSPRGPAFVGRRSPMVCPLAKLGRTSPTMEPPTYRQSPSVEVYRRSPLDPSVYLHQLPPRMPDGLPYRKLSSPASPLKEGSQYFRNQTGYKSEFRNSPNITETSFFRNDNYQSLIQTDVREQVSTRAPLSMVETSFSKQRNKLLQNGPPSSYQQHDPLRCSPALRRASSPTVDLFMYQTTDFDTSYKLGRSSPSLDQGYHTLVSPSPGPSTPGPWSDYNSLTTVTATGKGKKLYGNKSSSSLFEKLPDEVMTKIFSLLDSSDLCVCARVCKRWESIAWEPQLWRIIKLSGESVCGDKAIRCVLRRLCGQGTTGACPTVERVMLSDGAKISDKGLTQLARRCTELTHLQLQGCSAITNNALFELVTKCTNLQHLDLTGCSKISRLRSIVPGPEPPSRLYLQYLDLTDCSAIDDGGLRVVVRNCPQLVYLYLRRCVQITDTGIKFIPSFCWMLRELSVSDCNRVTDFGLHELAKLGATLRYLSVAKCDRVSDAGLKVIARRCYKLRYLNARGCEAVSDDAITVLARSCPRLRALDIGKCDVSDAGLRALAESCPNLKKLSLRNCDLVTDRGVQCIAYYCRGLQQLNIQDCQISIDGYRAVKKYCKRCVIEHTNPGFF